MPNITGKWHDGRINEGGGWLGDNGAVYKIGDTGWAGGDRWIRQAQIGFDASRCSDVYGKSVTVQQAALQLIAQLKF